MTTLFTCGINDNNTAKMFPAQNGRVSYSYDGCCGVFWFMDFDAASTEAITLFGDTYKQQQENLKTKPSLKAA